MGKTFVEVMQISQDISVIGYTLHDMTRLKEEFCIGRALREVIDRRGEAWVLKQMLHLLQEGE